MGLLDVREVSLSFGGLQALGGVTLDVDVGHVTGLIGPNGAGKTTLFNVVTGLLSPDVGRVTLDGEEITRARPHQRSRMGIGRTFQRLETFGTLTARENVLVAAETAWSSPQAAGRRGDRRDHGAHRHRRGGRRARRPAPTGTARLVELGRALATHPRVLLLDEPSAGLNEAETSTLGALLRDLAGTGLAVLLVEHDMAFVMGTCERIHVLDFGMIIAAGSPADVQGNADVRTAYLGEGGKQPTEEVVVDVAAAEKAEDGAGGAVIQGTAPALELQDVTAGYGPIDVLHGVSLSVPVGSVFALLGPNGAGKSTTLKVASGQIEPSGGDVLLHGGSIRGRSADALARRVCAASPRAGESSRT